MAANDAYNQGVLLGEIKAALSNLERRVDALEAGAVEDDDGDDDDATPQGPAGEEALFQQFASAMATVERLAPKLKAFAGPKPS